MRASICLGLNLDSAEMQSFTGPRALSIGACPTSCLWLWVDAELGYQSCGRGGDGPGGGIQGRGDDFEDLAVAGSFLLFRAMLTTCSSLPSSTTRRFITTSNKRFGKMLG